MGQKLHDLTLGVEPRRQGIHDFQEPLDVVSLDHLHLGDFAILESKWYKAMFV